MTDRELSDQAIAVLVDVARTAGRDLMRASGSNSTGWFRMAWLPSVTPAIRLGSVIIVSPWRGKPLWTNAASAPTKLSVQACRKAARALLANSSRLTHTPPISQITTRRPNACGGTSAQQGWPSMISTHSISPRVVRRHGLVLAASFGLSLIAGSALAYTAEQQQACTGDAMRLCGAFVPDVDRITVCMVQNKAQLTPACRAHFGPTPVAMQTNEAVRRKPTSLKPRKPHKRERQ